MLAPEPEDTRAIDWAELEEAFEAEDLDGGYRYLDTVTGEVLWFLPEAVDGVQVGDPLDAVPARVAEQVVRYDEVRRNPQRFLLVPTVCASDADLPVRERVREWLGQCGIRPADPPPGPAGSEAREDSRSNPSDLAEAARGFGRISEDLALAAEHARTASNHLAASEVPRACAHAVALEGHVRRALSLLDEFKVEHALRSTP